MNWTNFWPTLVPAVAAIVEVFSGAVGPYLASHPTIALLLGAAITAAANALSPKK